MEKIAIKREELEKLEVKIKKLNQKRNRLVKDIELLEMQQKSEQYAALEIKIENLKSKRTKLKNEIELLELQEKKQDYEALEISLKEKNMTLRELLESLK